MASDSDNPFGDGGDSERTVIRPMPGRRPAGGPPTGQPPIQAAAPQGPSAPVSISATQAGVNPVLGAATVLLSLAARLGRTTAQRDVPTLRTRVIEELKAFEQRLRGNELPAASLRGAHYAICATIDDVVLNTPWGGQSGWGAQSLISTFHNDVTGGERFFDILNVLKQEPGRNVDVLELMYACLSLGMEGKYRVAQRGNAELARVREDLYRILRQLRGEPERVLSPRWLGVPAPHRPLTSLVPVWVVALAACLLLVLGYMAATFPLSDASDSAFLALAQLPPRGAVVALGSIPSAVAAPVPTPPPPPACADMAGVAAGLVKVCQEAQQTTFTLLSTEMFAPGSASIETKYVDLLQRIAKEIETRPGKVLILGHTDSVPIHTLRFPSNYELSVARANAAKAIIQAGLSHPDRVTAEGRGDSEPVAPDDPKKGQPANRRIEIRIVKEPAA